MTESQDKRMEAYEKQREDLCARLGLTPAMQKQILAEIELETPGLFESYRVGEKFSATTFKAELALRENKLSEYVARYVPGAEISKGEIMMLMAGMLQLKTDQLLTGKRHEDKLAGSFPELAAGDRKAMVFLEAIAREWSKQSGRRYAGPKAAEMLALAPVVAEKRYGEAAHAELRQMGLVSSAAMGELIYRLVAKGILRQEEEDRIEEFQIRSALDDFFEQRS